MPRIACWKEATFPPILWEIRGEKRRRRSGVYSTSLAGIKEEGKGGEKRNCLVWKEKLFLNLSVGGKSVLEKEEGRS